MAPETEILVHITASSTSKDDAAYRALATAYLDFVPNRTVDLAESRAPHVPTALPAELDSPQASFRSAWGNIRPPAARPHSQESQHSVSQDGGKSQDSWVQPPSEVADSMPDNDISLDSFTTPTRVLRYHLQTVGSPSEASPELGRKQMTTIYDGENDMTSLLARDTTEIRDGANVLSAPASREKDGPGERTIQSHHSTPEVQQTSSEDRSDSTHVTQTPSSPLRSRGALRPHVQPDNSSWTRRKRTVTSSWSSESEIADIIIPSTQLPERADSEPPPPKRRKSNNLEERAHGLARSSSDVLPRGSKQNRDPQPDMTDGMAVLEAPSLDWSDTTELVSIEPSTANHKLGPRAPAFLEDFCKKFGTKHRYKPHFQAREMQPYERGYWLLTMDGWAQEARVKTWGFLGNYIRRDSAAGWGTRACRDDGWNWIRLYGWEHIAGELYILLYVSSWRRMKYMDITWYDGAGKELIIVGARGEKSISD